MGFNYDTWGGSWGTAWGNSWGTVAPSPSPAPAPSPAAAPEARPAGGWEPSRELFFAPRKWAVIRDGETKTFDTPEAAADYLEEIKPMPEPGKAIVVGKAPIVEYAGLPVNDIKIQGKTALQILKENDERLLIILLRNVEQQLVELEEEEIFRMLAAIVATIR